MALGDIAGLLSPLIESAEKLHTVFIPIALQMLALAFVLAVLFAVYQWWTGEVSGALARITRAAIIFIIPLSLLAGDNWKSTMDATSKFFSAGLTEPILNVGGATSGVDAINETINKLTAAMFPNARKPDTRSNFDKLKDFVMNNESFGGMLVSALSQALIELLLFVLALVMSVALIFALYGPLLALHIGIIFGPLLIAWMPFGPTSHLARNWLQFMLSQGFALVVGITIAMLAVSSIETFTDTIAAMSHDPNMPLHQELMAKIGAFMASAAVIIFVSFMLFRADDIAAAMIGGGGAGAGSVGAVIMSRLAATKSPQTPKGPPKPPGG